MDTITSLAVSIDNPVIKSVGTVLENSFLYAGILILLMFVGERRNEKRFKIVISLLVTLAIASIIKITLAYERPCVGEGWCPEGYSFPSTHAALAFTLMTAFMNRKSYLFFLFFALFVGFTRLNLGVHVFQDIAGALPIALISYYLTYVIWQENKGNVVPFYPPLRKENKYLTRARDHQSQTGGFLSPRAS